MNIEQTIRDYIPNIIHMSLGTSRDNKPWVCEVHFAYDENLNIYFRSRMATRHSQEITDNPHVAGNIVVQHAPNVAPMGVYFEGTATHLEAGDEQNKAAECIQQRLEPNYNILEDAQEEDGHHFYKITVNTFYVFGSLDGKPHQKYELSWKK
jgi:uncharacterized protein YhbP (UPF0306 family)